jgi:uncharacterized protein YkwD
MTSKHKKKRKEPNSKIGVCHYHLCRKKTRVYRCKYCGEYFCKEHLQTKPPGLPRFDSTKHEDRLFMEEWHKPGGHPCVPYLEIWKAEQERKEEEYRQALDKFLRSKPIEQEPVYKTRKIPISRHIPKKSNYGLPFYERIKRWFNYRKHPYSHLRIRSLIKDLVYLSILLIFTFVIYGNIEPLNEIVIIFLKLGSLLLLGSCILSLKYIYRIIINLKYGFRGLKNGYKLIITILLLALVFHGWQNHETYFYEVKNVFGEINYSYFNPLFITSSEISEFLNENKIGSEKKVISQDIVSKVTKPEINISQLEKRIHELVNEERKKYGLTPLKWDDKLALITRKHSQDMALNNYFDHINLKGEDPTERGLKEGYRCYKNYGSYYTEGIAENIFQNNLYDSVTYINGIPVYDYNSLEEIAESTVEGWMESPGHRSNILNKNYDREGIGVAISNDDKVYITQDFC